MNRVIFFGRIEFENERSICLAKDRYIHFNDNMAKNDSLFKPKDLFGEDLVLAPEQLSFDFSRSNHNDVQDKTLDHTIGALRALMDYATAGRIEIFKICNDLVERLTIHAVNHKTVPQGFLAGRLALEAGNFEVAIRHFTEILSKYPSHSWALDGRGHAHLALIDSDPDHLLKAEEDFTAAIEAYPTLASAHYGMARIQFMRKKWNATFDACRKAMEHSIPHQPGYWITGMLNADAAITMLEENPPSDNNTYNALFKQTQSLLTRYAKKLESLPISNPCEDDYELSSCQGGLAVAKTNRGGLVLNNSLLDFEVINATLFPSQELFQTLQTRLDSLHVDA